MDIKEVAELLNWNRDYVTAAIEQGVELPVSKQKVKLAAISINTCYEIDEAALDSFIDCFEQEEPGRKPPVKIMRQLRIEAGHRCPVCGHTASLEYHHIIEFAKLKHHDPNHMIALCPNCHTLCSTGKITYDEQRKYKERLKNNGLNKDTDFSGNGPVRFNWFDLDEIIRALHNTISNQNPDPQSKYDFTDLSLDQKNELNHLGGDYFSYMRHEHEPYFGMIDEFLKNPSNNHVANLYYEIVEELRAKIAANQNRFNKFEDILLEFADAAVRNIPAHLSNKRRVIHILISFMYFNCDIGRKV